MIQISHYLIPFIIMAILLYGTFKKVPTYEKFVEGGKEGVQLAISLLPFLLGMIVSISILRASGALEAFVNLIEPVLSLFHIPPEIVPLALTRPIRSEEHTSELQSRGHLVCRLLLEKKKKNNNMLHIS